MKRLSRAGTAMMAFAIWMIVASGVSAIPVMPMEPSDARFGFVGDWEYIVLETLYFFPEGFGEEATGGDTVRVDGGQKPGELWLDARFDTFHHQNGSSTSQSTATGWIRSIAGTPGGV